MTTIFRRKTLFIFIYPLLAIVGAISMNVLASNLPTMVFLLLVAIGIVYISAREMSSLSYSIVIYALSVSLLWHNSLVSNHLWGDDVQSEYYFASQVLTNAHWVSSIANDFNSVLSIVMLAPMYSLVVGLNLVQTFKIVYPALYSLVPVGLFYIFRKQTNERIAFLAVCYFMSAFPFYADMLQVARQQIAELFLMLLLVIGTTVAKSSARTIVMLLAAIGLVVSHYSTAYFYIFVVVLAYFIITVRKSSMAVTGKSGQPYDRATPKGGRRWSLPNGTDLLEPYLILFLGICAFLWVSFAALGLAFGTLVVSARNIIANVASVFSKIGTVQGITAVTSPQPFAENITRYLTILMLALAVVGLVGVMYGRNRMKIRGDYLAMSSVALVVAGASFVLPYFAASLQIDRVYNLSLIFLAPFAIIGFLTLIGFVQGLLPTGTGFHWPIRRSYAAAGILIATFLLFNSGFFYVLANETPSSFTTVSLNSQNDPPIFNNQEYTGAAWLVQYAAADNHTFADENRQLLFSDFTNQLTDPVSVLTSFSSIPSGSYVFLGTYNIESSSVLVGTSRLSINPTSEYLNSEKVTVDNNLIFSSGATSIFFTIRVSSP